MDIKDEVLRKHKEFVGDQPHRAHVMQREGIKFFIVGRNASHDFFIGTKDGKRFILSFGEGPDEGSYRYRMEEVESWCGRYLGHY